jgi:hypothetical protein
MAFLLLYGLNMNPNTGRVGQLHSAFGAVSFPTTRTAPIIGCNPVITEKTQLKSTVARYV